MVSLRWCTGWLFQAVSMMSTPTVRMLPAVRFEGIGGLMPARHHHQMGVRATVAPLERGGHRGRDLQTDLAHPGRHRHGAGSAEIAEVVLVEFGHGCAAPPPCDQPAALRSVVQVNGVAFASASYHHSLSAVLI